MFRLLPFLLLALISTLSCEPQTASSPTGKKKKLSAGYPAPALARMEWTGDGIEDLEKGKVYVLEFWKIWCKPCIQHMPQVAEIAREYRDRGVVVVALTSPDDRGGNDLVRNYIIRNSEKLGISFGVHPDGEVEQAYLTAADIHSYPATFIIDREGNIAHIGFPWELDDVLPGVVDGTWNNKTSSAQLKEAYDEIERLVDASLPAETLWKSVEELDTKYPFLKKSDTFQTKRLSIQIFAKKFSEADALTESLVKDRVARKRATLVNELREYWLTKSAESYADRTKPIGTITRAMDELSPTAMTATEIALTYQKLGDSKLAQEWFDKALSRNPEPPLAEQIRKARGG